jgi:hypothetical protein
MQGKERIMTSRRGVNDMKTATITLYSNDPMGKR